MGPISPEVSPPTPEVGSPVSPPPLQQAEPRSSDDEGLYRRISEYEQRLLSLGREFIALKREVEAQANRIKRFRKENEVLVEENGQERVESLERKQEELGSQNIELFPIISEQEGTFHSNQLCLDEKTWESCLLNRKSKEVLDDDRQDD